MNIRLGLLMIVFITIIFSCNDTGKLVGVDYYKNAQKKLPKNVKEFMKDMVFIGPGSMNTGIDIWDINPKYNESDSLVDFRVFVPSKTVSIAPFYMSNHEVSNYEYKKFIYWVRDSIARTILAEDDPTFWLNKEFGWVNWDKPIDWSNTNVKERLFKTSTDEKLILNTDTLEFKFATLNYSKLHSRRKFTESNDSISYIDIITLKIYPDTLVWVKDFPLAYNEPMSNLYFAHPAYDDYPVVGVSWQQANAYCEWMNIKINQELKNSKNPKQFWNVRLPSSLEWDYVAKNSFNEDMEFNNKSYESSSIDIDLFLKQDDKGHPYKINFGQIRDQNNLIIKDYNDDGYDYTCPVKTFKPNSYGMFNLSGNVREWTQNEYVVSTYIVSDLNLDYVYQSDTIPDYLRRRDIKGGSWKDGVAYLLPFSTSFLHENKSNSKTGFRIAMSYYSKRNSSFY